MLSSIDALSLSLLNSNRNEDIAIVFVKARDLITQQGSSLEIINELRSGMKTENSQFVQAQLFAIKQNGREISKFATEMECECK